MCGRFMFGGDGPQLRHAFGLASEGGAWGPAAANIAPSQLAPALVLDASGALDARQLRFGWPHPRGGSALLINARLETVARLPTFRGAWQAQRCVVPASGFYEWAAGPAPRQPFAFVRADGACFGLAALWRPAPLPGAPDGALVILTEAAQAPVAQVHGRMPVMLAASDASAYVRGPPPEDLSWPRMEAGRLQASAAQPAALRIPPRRQR